MQLREQLLKEHSKANTDLIIAWIGHSQQRFDELVQLFLEDEYRVVQRAAWPLSYVVEKHPAFIKKHLGKLIRYVQQPGQHEAVKRNTVRMLQGIVIPEKYQGTVMDLCFNYIADVREKPAVKAFSLTVLENLATQYPEILQELKTVIEERWDTETPAFHSRAKKILKRMKS